jgi:hypothetical protein
VDPRLRNSAEFFDTLLETSKDKLIHDSLKSLTVDDVDTGRNMVRFTRTFRCQRPESAAGPDDLAIGIAPDLVRRESNGQSEATRFKGLIYIMDCSVGG